MRLYRALTAATLCLVAGTGCDLYLGDHNSKPPPCEDFVGDPVSNSSINPYTGICEYQSGPAPGPCGYGGYEGDLPYPADVGGAMPQRNWPSCDSQCSNLPESDCLVTAGCRGNYVLGRGGQRFDSCTAVAPWGSANSRSCAERDAQSCTETDNCSSVYNRPLPTEKTPPLQSYFDHCQAEQPVKGCYGDQDCGPGYDCTSDTECLPSPDCGPGQACPPVCYGRCVKKDVVECAPDACPVGTICAIACSDPGMGMPGQEVDGSCSIQCIPEPQSCAVVDCAPGYSCVEQCKECPPNADCTGSYLCQAVCVPSEPVTCDNIACGIGSHCEVNCDGSPDGPVMQGCTATCVADDGGPGTCDSNLVACDAAAPACPIGTVAGVRNACWSGYCIPVSDCGPLDPGVCGVAACATPPPSCPLGTEPGVKGGCWSGYCIPSNQCAAVDCSALTEMTCSTRSDCSPVYNGDNCTCYPWGCSCETTTFARCEVAIVPLPTP